jgi:type II secretory ATPase GspE/PulE/Tfp pilus assembly ATPase PilB-like protein
MCAADYDPPVDVLKEFFAKRPEGLTFKRGTGCPDCNYTGYLGRTTMVELWIPDDEDVLAITKGTSFDRIRTSSRRTTLSMCDTMWEALEQGRTNLEELIRILPAATIAEFKQRRTASSLSASA